jgi:hypothetical protein
MTRRLRMQIAQALAVRTKVHVLACYGLLLELDGDVETAEAVLELTAMFNVAPEAIIRIVALARRRCCCPKEPTRSPRANPWRH